LKASAFIKNKSPKQFQRDRGLAAGVLSAVLAFILLLPLSVAAQEAQRRQYESMPSMPGAGTPSTSHISFPEAEDEEIGQQFLLRRRIAVPQFSLSGDTQYFYNSNPRLLDGDASDDFLFVGSGTLAWNPTWIKGASVSVFARQQFFRYNSTSDMDFNSTAFGLNIGTAVRDWFNVNYGYTATRLESRPTGQSFYDEGDASVMFSRTEKLGQRFSLPYGYTMDYFHTSPGDFNRITHGIFTGLNCAITPKFLGQFFYRFQYEDYNNISREDRSHVLSITLTYFITDWASVRAFASWSTNKSTIDRNYDALNSGLGASLVWRF
jgi:hypothetical protein